MTIETDSLLTRVEVAELFRVCPPTVTRWANAGKLTPVKTLGGHRRYRESEIRALLADPGVPAPNGGQFTAKRKPAA